MAEKKNLMTREGLKALEDELNDLKLNKELYKYEDIILVTKVFSHLALIEVEEDNNYWKCRFKNCRYNTEQTELEFENYLIDYINSKGRKNDHL